MPSRYFTSVVGGSTVIDIEPSLSGACVIDCKREQAGVSIVSAKTTIRNRKFADMKKPAQQCFQFNYVTNN